MMPRGPGSPDCQLGHFLHACYAHQFEHVGRLYHKAIPKTSDTKMKFVHIGVKLLAMGTKRNKSAYMTFWGLPFHVSADAGYDDTPERHPFHTDAKPMNHFFH